MCIDSVDLAIYYFVFINIALFIMMGIDKRKAKKNQYRISEAMLITVGVFGGALGGLIGMQCFRHKTKKSKFYFAYILSICLYLALIIYYINGMLETYFR